MKLFIYLIALMSLLAFSINANANLLNSQGQAPMPPASPHSSSQYAPPQPDNRLYAPPATNAPSINNANKPAKLYVSPAKIKAVKKVVSKAVNALAKKNYTKFIKTSSPAFKSIVSKASFDKVSNSLNNKLQLKNGYDIKYLVALKQAGLKFYMWKLMLKSGKAVYIKTVIQNNKIAGMSFL
ncbi:MAG: hypothetical protein M1412_00010 [Deltaproteobacteria bacterium]|nr:hypothetical protein [Deltaproteobacteria bacterium]MCL5891535.1 hypothetical protein [Deltaproteobacteria bacterium]